MRTYLPFSFHMLAAFCLLILFFISGLSLFVGISLYSLIIFLYRKKNLTFEKMIYEGEIVVAPMSGKVISTKLIKKNNEHAIRNLIRIKIKPWEEKGIYFPIVGELTEANFYQSKDIDNYDPLTQRRRKLQFLFLTSKGEKLKVEFRAKKCGEICQISH